MVVCFFGFFLDVLRVWFRVRCIWGVCVRAVYVVYGKWYQQIKNKTTEEEDEEQTEVEEDSRVGQRDQRNEKTRKPGIGGQNIENVMLNSKQLWGGGRNLRSSSRCVSVFV